MAGTSRFSGTTASTKSSPSKAAAVPVLSGTCRNSAGAFAKKAVRVYNRGTGVILGAAFSDPINGEWSISTADAGPYFAVQHDSDTGDLLWRNVALALHMDGAHGSTVIVDEKGAVVTAGTGVSIDTSRAMFGGSSLKITDGVSGHLTTPTSPAFEIGQRDFSVEMWLSRTANNISCGLFDMTTSGANKIYLDLDCPAGGTPAAVRANVGNATRLSSSYSIPIDGAFLHVELSRSGSATGLFLGGQLVASGTSANYISAAPIKIGSAGFAGFLDDFRFTVGTARNVSTFTPPSAPFPNALAGGTQNAQIFDLLGGA